MEEAPLAGSTADWLSASQNGDAEAFGKLVEQHQREVYALVFRMTGRGHVADDLTQEAFVSAWENLKGFRGTASFRTWLFRIAMNKARSYWRWQKLRNWVSLDDKQDDDAKPLSDLVADPARASDPASAFEDLDFQDNLQSALLEFPPRQREVIALRAQGLEIQEIASALSIAAGTVKAHLFEAKQKLQEKMGIKR